MKYILIFFIIVYFLSVSSAQSVTLNWIDTSTSELGFGIERAVGSGAFSYLAGVSANIQTYTDSTAQSSNTYLYRIYAWNSYGNSTYSNTATVTINAQGQGASSGGGSGGGSSGGGGGGAGSVSSGGSSGGGLTASVTPPSGSSGSSSPVTGNSVNENQNQNSNSISGLAVGGDDLRKLSPLAVYSIIGLLIGIVFFIVVWKKMNNITVTVEQDVYH